MIHKTTFSQVFACTIAKLATSEGIISVGEGKGQEGNLVIRANLEVIRANLEHIRVNLKIFGQI